MWTYRATVIRVIDGDTVDLDIDLGFDVRHRTRVRIDRIDAPETSTPEGKAARTHVTNLLTPGLTVTATTRQDRREKYGRWLATITLPDGTDLATNLLTTGHAHPYTGGPRRTPA